MRIRRRQGWELPECRATDEKYWLDRRRFIAAMGFGLGSVATLGCGASADGGVDEITVSSTIPPARAPYPFSRNESIKLDRAMTDETVSASFNNFYEFTTDKAGVWKLTGDFETRPWTLEVGGLVSKPQTFDVETLVATMPMEERLYRFRCVEAWSMSVPWTGFPLRELLRRVEPRSNANFVRFVSFNRPDQAVGIREQSWYDWPYYEALRIDEAMNELTLVVTGIYGHELPKQHGAPIRIVTPWKYGYKSPKSIVRIELVESEPNTFWNDLAPDEYGFMSNVDPKVPHPRWSQATERIIGTGERVVTLPYNGYGEWVGRMYS